VNRLGHYKGLKSGLMTNIKVFGHMQKNLFIRQMSFVSTCNENNKNLTKVRRQNV